MKKKHKKLPFIIAGVVVVAGVGFFALRGQGTQAVNNQAVAVVPVTTGDVQEYVNTSGTVESRNKKTFFSPVKKMSSYSGSQRFRWYSHIPVHLRWLPELLPQPDYSQPGFPAL